ncbi:MAG: site-2 protease family protein [Planctomycetes bacterium]|nr:site-2 protease family protein [Planctomycetota bacterium]MCK5579387.1 site-2 protease family protein [Planctomycetota bacterium]
MGLFPVAFIILMFSAIIHECAHGYAAYRLGDPTAYHAGRITLNPVKHIDPMMTIIVPLISYFSFGFIFGGAKPVPINPYNFRNPEKGMLISSLAGPAANFSLALIGFGFFAFTARLDIFTGSLAQFNYIVFYLLIIINLILGIFNLIPIPPLDGSRVLRYFLPWDMKSSFDRMEPFGFFIIIFVVMIGGFNFIHVILDQVGILLQKIAGG